MSAERLYAQEEKSSNWGPKLVLGGAGLAIVGEVTGIKPLVVFGVIAVGAGGAAWFWGRRNKNK